MKPYHVIIADNHMVLMNEDGDSFACNTIDAGYAAAKTPNSQVVE